MVPKISITIEHKHEAYIGADIDIILKRKPSSKKEAESLAADIAELIEISGCGS